MMMKRLVKIAAMVTLAAALTGCSGNGREETSNKITQAPASQADTAAAAQTDAEAASQEENPESGTGYQPSKNITWVCTSSAGGNSDIFTRTMAEIASDITGNTIVCENNTDGGGTVGQRNVANLKGSDAEYTLLTFTTGDLPSLLQNSDLRLEDYQPIATLLSDLHMVYVPTGSRFKTFEDFVTTLQTEKIVMGGSKGDDIMFYNLLKATIDPNDNLSYLQYTATNETAVAVLGGHVEIAIGKPAVCTAYIESGDFVPLAIEGDKRAAAPYEDTPTFNELGYGEISFIQFRSVFASKNMPAEAVEYWCNVFKKVSESEEINTNYANKYLSTVSFMDSQASYDYYSQAQENCMKLLEIK